jgi:hypothetical protein
MQKVLRNDSFLLFRLFSLFCFSDQTGGSAATSHDPSVEAQELSVHPDNTPENRTLIKLEEIEASNIFGVSLDGLISMDDGNQYDDAHDASQSSKNGVPETLFFRMPNTSGLVAHYKVSHNLDLDDISS